MVVAETLTWALILYAGIGLIFGLLFVTIGISRVDSQAGGASLGFRLIILPGVAGLWPLLLMRWISGRYSPWPSSRVWPHGTKRRHGIQDCIGMI